MEQIIATAKQQEYQHYNYTHVSQTAISSTEKEEPTSKGNQKELSTGIPKIIQQRYIDTVQPMTKEAHIQPLPPNHVATTYRVIIYTGKQYPI